MSQSLYRSASHVSGAHDDDRRAFKTAELLLGSLDGRGCNGSRFLADTCLRAGRLSSFECVAKEPV